MSIMLKVYPTFAARANASPEDLTTVVYTRKDLSSNIRHLIKKAEHFCRLNGYYGYDLFVNGEMVSSANQT